MMLAPADLKRLRIPLAIALVLAGIGVGSLLFAQERFAQAELEQKEAKSRLAAAKAKLAKVSEEEQEISNNLIKFKQFTDKGMTGDEKRLEWIETLSAIRQQRRLFEVRYNLERQRLVDYPGIKGTDAIFMASRLKLELLILHEADLLNFIGDLQSNTHSFASLRSCSITRMDGGAGGGGPLRARLRADCLVDMITIKPPEKTT
jgi:hypothetical protein